MAGNLVGAWFCNGADPVLVDTAFWRFCTAVETKTGGESVTILDRYIARIVVNTTLMVLLVLGALLAFVDFVGEIGEVGKGQYDLFDAIYYVILALPKRIYELFPTAVLLGSLLGLGALASNSELTVMRASGVSIRRFVRSVLQACLLYTSPSPRD